MKQPKMGNEYQHINFLYISLALKIVRKICNILQIYFTLDLI